MGTLISSIIQYRQFGNHILRGIQSSQENDIDYVLHKKPWQYVPGNYATIFTLPMKCPKKNIFISAMPLEVN